MHPACVHVIILRTHACVRWHMHVCTVLHAAHSVSVVYSVTTQLVALFMALYRYFQVVDGENPKLKLPDPHGPLCKDVPCSSMADK